MFNPSHAAQHLAPDGVDALADIKPLSHHNLIEGMKSEVHAYLTACMGVVVDTTSMESFTNSVLLFWRRNGHNAQVPDVGGGSAHHVRHDAELRERRARLLAPQGHVR